MGKALLMALRAGRDDQLATEAEPVVVEQAGEIVRLILDDGETVEFDRTELLAACGGMDRRAA